MDRQMRRSWEASGRETMADRVRAKAQDILEHHQPPLVPADVKARLKELVAEADQRHKT